jgi:hypothetical protein
MRVFPAGALETRTSFMAQHLTILEKNSLWVQSQYLNRTSQPFMDPAIDTGADS